MFERFKRNGGTDDGYDDRGTVATAERPVDRHDDPRYADDGRSRATARHRRHQPRDDARRSRPPAGRVRRHSTGAPRSSAGSSRSASRSILLAILSAAGTAFGLSDNVSKSDAKANADTIGLVGGILLIAVLAIAYYCGGYVSGRMSRFDGGRQGFGTWAIGLIVTIVLAVAGVVFGAEVQRARAAEPAAHPDRRGHAHDGRRRSRSRRWSS